MLVLARKLNESICVGDDVRVTIVEIRPGRVRLGIEAPADVRIRREEIAGSREPLATFEVEMTPAASARFLRTSAVAQPMICGINSLESGRKTRRKYAGDSVE